MLERVHQARRTWEEAADRVDILSTLRSEKRYEGKGSLITKQEDLCEEQQAAPFAIMMPKEKSMETTVKVRKRLLGG